MEPDYKVHLYGNPSDPRFSSQWHHPKIASSVAWDTTVGSKTVKVCVLDSGMRIDHPDLAGNVAKGWNVIPPTVAGQLPAATDPAWTNYNDTLGHGTHVAGIIGALGNNARGVAGVAWSVSLLPCRFIGDNGAGYVSDAIACMRLCRNEGAHVYSNSWGGVGYSATLLAEIQALKASNGLFVVAAGNNDGLNLDTTPLYPASYTEDNVLTIAATNKNDGIASFSNIGPVSVHLAAPGESIFSTTHDGGYGSMSGTSMATPVVSGAAALLQGMALAANAPLAPVQLRQLLMGSVDPIVNGFTFVSSGGRLNIAKALVAFKAQFPTRQVPAPVPVPGVITPGASPLPVAPRTPITIPINGGKAGVVTVPSCGSSVLRGQSAAQSSTYKGRAAGNAVNGDCRSDITKYASACTSTGEFK